MRTAGQAAAQIAACALFGQRLERLRLVHCEIGEDFAVDLDAGLVQPVDKSAVGQADLASGGIDALNPQGAEIALSVLAVAIGILAGLLDRLARERMVFLRRP